MTNTRECLRFYPDNGIAAASAAILLLEVKSEKHFKSIIKKLTLGSTEIPVHLCKIEGNSDKLTIPRDLEAKVETRISRLA